MADKLALVVDDDTANRAIWEHVLAGRGYQVVTAEDATGGLQLANHQMSLYLIDYHLPDGQGTAIVSYVREHYPASIVVMVSMDDDADVIRESLRAGGNIFLVKPTSPSMMGQLIDEIEAGAVSAEARQLISRHGRRNYS
ncbi:MAG: response regulator [Anaerolineae bacterium]|nr:response regulator [Anaerolineae bacterium]